MLTGITSIPALAQAPVVRASPADIAQRLARIEQQLQNQGLLDMLRQLESLQSELSQLRGELEVQKRSIEELNRRQQSLYTDIDQRLQGVEGGTATDLTSLAADPVAGANPPLQTLVPGYSATDQVTAPSDDTTLNIQMLPSTPAAAGTETVTTIAPAPDEAQTPVVPAPAVAESGAATDPTGIDAARMEEAYQQAWDLLKQGQYDPAIQAFAAFLVNYPAGDYSDNAQYWLGEAYYVTRRFEQALQEYNKLVINFPHSQKYTHAMLKIGYCFQELGRTDEARKYLQALVRQYPGETASRLAEERLKSIALTEQQSGALQN
jgi:tol-pal system protein YbgF